ncbi:uncharacterized protein PHALS_02742 [Plasmopara halstedii]|uniref:Uncharacterized protein n=1 Tax=Plasmopara halstedii TaxID=4781 RepID=A0A0P1AYT4_PLAHL|nr:uncharacterized protein PHALS_02742 [Plasmopara halstedii]CEG46338.1 hypothetical protein PHALS_02742 [Plasmopara halstedii]|eukprot:XP_024582707.1 hypothetical protein PHALS_02742 [Plasmopara halstedii]
MTRAVQRITGEHSVIHLAFDVHNPMVRQAQQNAQFVLESAVHAYTFIRNELS